MGRRSVVERKSPLGLVPIEVDSSVRANEPDRTELLHTRSTLFAVAEAALAGITLGTYAHAVANFNVSFRLRTNPDGSADDLVPDAAWIIGRTLSQNQSYGQIGE